MRYPFFVPRNSRGSLPVYTDIKNNGTRQLVLIRNVEGNANVRDFSKMNTFLSLHSTYVIQPRR